MTRVLEQLRGVVGVTGVIILDRRTGLAESLLTARFSETKKEQLDEIFRKLLGCLQGESTFKVRFDSGWMMIHSYEDYALLILAKDDLNFETLKLVIKSSLVSLRSVSVTPAAQASQKQEITPESIAVAIEAFNSISEYLMTASGIGPYGTSTFLRQAREDILDQFPLLKNFAVDNNGRVDLIRGADKKLDSKIIIAIAWWSLAFRDKVNTKKPVFNVDIRSITKQHEEELNSMGFYAAYLRASSQPVRG